MNRKGIFLLVVLCISFFAIASVSATDFTNHDFHGYFSMKVPEGMSFEEDFNESNENGIDQIFAIYASENIVIVYMDSIMYSDNSSVFCYQTFFESMNPESMGCYESQEGNLTILEATTNDGSELSLVGLSNGNKMIMVAGDDVEVIKTMARSAEFG